MDLDLGVLLDQARSDALYLKDSAVSAFKDRCDLTKIECDSLHFSGCESELLDAKCVGNETVIFDCAELSCEEVRDTTYTAGEW